MSDADSSGTADVDERVTHGECVANGVRLHYVEAGPAGGPPVVLLHGFPEYWYSWRHQIGPLADAGFRVVAPDLRGYNRSEKPHGVEPYRLAHLVADVAESIETLTANGGARGDREATRGDRNATVVGHDWGGIVAWLLATARPDVVERIAALNAPHPAEFVRNFSLEQSLRSSYALWYQVPWLPETLYGLGDGRVLEKIFELGTTRPDAFTDADVARFRRAFARSGVRRSALNYYRAFFRGTFREHLPGALPLVGSRLVEPVPEVEIPTLVLWGERDPALSNERVEGLEAYASDLRLERYPDASHWVHADVPDRVTARLIDFLETERDP